MNTLEKTDKICISKSITIFALGGLAVIGFIVFATLIGKTTTSSNTRAANPQCIYETMQDCKADGCTGLCTKGGCSGGMLYQCKSVSAAPTVATTQIVPSQTSVTDANSCALNFKKNLDDKSGLCQKGGYIGDKEIADTYACEGVKPSEKDTCASGTQLNYYGNGSGIPSYSCYVSQKINALSAPSGCPIDSSKITCLDGFTYDEKGSKLVWSNGGSSWGCFYSCVAKTNPKILNPNWPCTKEGYKPIGGGGNSTCCAKY